MRQLPAVLVWSALSDNVHASSTQPTEGGGSNVGRNPPVLSSHRADCLRTDLCLCRLSPDPRLAVGLVMGNGSFALSDDDPRHLCDAWRLLADRVARSARQSQPDLVHGVVQ